MGAATNVAARPPRNREDNAASLQNHLGVPFDRNRVQLKWGDDRRAWTSYTTVRRETGGPSTVELGGGPRTHVVLPGDLVR